MQIRKRGGSIQLLRGTTSLTGSVSHKTLGSIPRECRSIKQVPTDIKDILSKKELFQLENYLGNLHNPQVSIGPKDLQDLKPLATFMLTSLGAESLQKSEEHLALAAFEALARELSQRGYGTEVVSIAHTQAFWNLEKFKIKSSTAAEVWDSWKGFKDKLGDLGFTQKWHSLKTNS